MSQEVWGRAPGSASLTSSLPDDADAADLGATLGEPPGETCAHGLQETRTGTVLRVVAKNVHRQLNE